MTSTNLYVLEWDKWNFTAVFKDDQTARKGIHTMETVTVYEVKGEIKDNKLFIVSDTQGDWVGIFATKEEAMLRKRLYDDSNYLYYEVKEIPLY